ncbi:MAG TPA: XRE family transcriptional regulator [Actinokineospora sp.]|jgi:hypothetical protein|nr:XRE family transcriptional regulator [Actinokineospora sp.]
MSRAELAEAANAWLWEQRGERFDLDARAIARYERGAVRWPGAHYRAALRHVLNAPDDAALGFRPAGQSGHPIKAEQPVALLLPGSVELGVSPAEFVSQVVLETPVPTRACLIEVDQVRATTAALARSENLFGGGLSSEAAAAQLRWASRLLGAQSPNRVRAGLLEAVGNLAGVVAFSAFDIGAHAAAARCFRFALWCADEGGSWELRAATLADMSRQAVHLGRLDEGLSLIEFAQVRADRLTTTTRAMLGTVRARLLACLGRSADALAEMSRADSFFTSSDTTAAPPWLTYYDWAEHLGSSARVFVPVAVTERRSGEAGTRLAAAIGLHSDAYPRSRALSRARLATLTMKIGDPREAAAIGRIAIIESASMHSTRMVGELQALHDVSVDHSDIPEVAELTHDLTTAVGSAGS